MMINWRIFIVMLYLFISLFHVPGQVLSNTPQYGGEEQGFSNISNMKQLYTGDSARHILNNSYYMKYIRLSRGRDYRDSLVLNYFVLNIDNDKYPDLLIWYPQKLVIWSMNKGVYAVYHALYRRYISKPIPVDVDKNGVIDYIVVIENSYLDARIYRYRELRSVVSTVKIWYPLTGYIRIIRSYRGIFIISTTYYMYKGRIFIPTIINYYVEQGYYYKKFYSRIGLFMLNIKTLTTKLYYIKTYYTNYIYDPGKPEINDYTTNYEIYITGILNHMFIIPMGLDKIIRVEYRSGLVFIINEKSIGPIAWNDKQIVVARQEPAISIAGYTSSPLYMANYWRSPQHLELIYSFGTIIIPFGEFIYKSPAYSENGVYFRIERIKGVIVYEPYYDIVYKRVILGRYIRISGRYYWIIAITSMTSGKYGLYLYMGVLAYGYDKLVIALIKYNWLGDRIYLLWYKFVPGNKLKFQITVNSDGDKIYATDLNTLYVDGLQLFFHINEFLPVTPQFTVYPPATINPRRIDIDGDGVYEYVFIMYYCDYTIFSYYPYGLMGLYPKIYNNIVFIVFFDKPEINIYIKCFDNTCRTISINLYYSASSISYGYLTIRDINGRIIYRDVFYGNKWYITAVFLDKVGIYYIDLLSITRYRINEWITGGNLPRIITYVEKLEEIHVINVRYKTRIILVKPMFKILTPNHYIDGLNIVFKLEYFDYKVNAWKPLLWQTPLLRVSVRNTTVNYESYPRSIGNGIYTHVFRFIKYPGEYMIYIIYQGSTYYAPTEIVENISLERYPVEISVEYTRYYPALTTYNVTVNLKYMYIGEDGKWYSTDLDNGFLKIRIFNESYLENRSIYTCIIPVNNPYTTININKYLVLPGNYSFTIEYIPGTIYYENKSFYGNYMVYPLSLSINVVDLMDNTSILDDPVVIYGSQIYVEIHEYISNNSWRKPSVPLNLIFIGKNNYSYIINGSSIINTSGIKPGNYTLVIHPVKYGFVYNQSIYKANITIVLRNARVVVEVVPLIHHKYSNEKFVEYIETNKTTYTLVPVKIVVKTYVEPLVELVNAKTTVIIDDRSYHLKPGNKTIIWIPVEPGEKEIIVIFETKYFRVINKTYLTIYPMPVRINISNGSIIVCVKDILGRPAEGLMDIEIYDLEKNMLFKKTYYVNGSIVIKNTEIRGWVYVRVYFKGNGSYLPTRMQKVIYIQCDETFLKPLPEPSYISSFITLSLITILLIKRIRHR